MKAITSCFFFFEIRRLCTELEMILQKAAPENEPIFLMIIIEIGVCLRAHLQMSEMSNENEGAKKLVAYNLQMNPCLRGLHSI